MSKSVILGLRIYQSFLSPFLGNCCRFYPTCSEYAVNAVAIHGAWRGSYLALRRVSRCHPWQQGGFDPVQENYVSKHD